MRIILCVTNDIATDRRVDRIALSLMKIPAEVQLIGRTYTHSMSLPALKYGTHRMKILFKKGPLFYAEYNLRLFFLLLFKKADLLVANDLDTLPAVFMVSKIRRKPMVYDSHEYFTEVPELIGRKWVKKIWCGLEALILPHIRFTYTVSASIAAEYKRKYGISMQVIRNLPFQAARNLKPAIWLKRDEERIIIYQGSLNMGRGLELAIRAMKFTGNSRLIIAGTGDVENKLKELTGSLALQEKVLFTGRILPQELVQYTVQADLGISLEEKLGLNYYYALPNKLFDYVQARVPVLVSDLPEMASIVTGYGIGRINHTNDPFELALVFEEMMTAGHQREIWLSNLEKAAARLCWENEEGILLDIYRKALTC